MDTIGRPLTNESNKHMQPDCPRIEKNTSRFEPSCFRAAGLYSNQMILGDGRKHRAASLEAKARFL